MESLMFTQKMKLADVLHVNHNLIVMLPRFGIDFGFGEKSIEEVCRTFNVSPTFFLMVCNLYTFDYYIPDKETIESINMPSLISYLKASHYYYLEERLPVIEANLYAIADACELKYGESLKRFFRDYKKELVDHFDYEEKIVFPYICKLSKGQKDPSYSISRFELIHSNIEDELNDLINILIKYLPATVMNKERIIVLSDIFHLAEDLNKHSLIEENIMIPFVESLELKINE